MKNSISAVIIAYNEEKKIEDCLKSVKGVVDEILLIHDGPCRDKTLEIAKKYTKRIIVRPRLGDAEFHRDWSLGEAKNEWVLAIDADERLTEGLRDNIRDLVKKDVDGYAFKWNFYDKGKLITKGPLSKNYRLCLFRRKKTKGPHKVHEWYQVNGRIINSDYVLDHKQPYDNWTMKGFFRKTKKWVKNDAKQRIESNSAQMFALLYIFKGLIWFGLLLPYFFIYKKLFLHGELGFRISLQNALYNLMLYYHVFKIKTLK